MEVSLYPAILRCLMARLYGWLPLSDASGICPCLCIPSVLLPLFPKALPWAGGSLPLSGAHSSERLLLMGIADVRVRYTRILNRVNGILSNNIRILTPKNGGCRSRKGHSVEKTAIFDVFRKVLTDKWLHGFLSVNGRFTKYKFAKGKVSLRERPCFVV